MLPAIHRGKPPLEKPKTPLLSPSNQERTLADEYWDRITAIERENDRLRHDVLQLQAAQVDESKLHALATECHELHVALHNKVQADAFYQEKDKQKAALIFGEIVRLGKAVEDVVGDLRQHVAATEQRLTSLERRLGEPTSTALANESALRDHDRALDELKTLVLATRSAVTQLKSETDAERWKTMEMGSASSNSSHRVDASALVELETRLTGLVDRVASRAAMDAGDVRRHLDEYREMQSATDARRASQLAQDMRRLAEHVGGLEQLLLHETKSMTAHVQAIVSESDIKFRAVVDELGHEVRHRNAAYVQLDDELRAQVADLRDATRDVTASVQTRLRDLEEVLPLEIQARQKGHASLKKRIDGLTKGTTSSIETIKKDLEASVSGVIARTNACVAHQIELEAAVARHGDDARSAVHTFQRDVHGAIAAALEATATEHAQRLVACMDVVDTVKALQATTDERFESVRQGWARLEATTLALLREQNAGQSLAVEELHTRLLALHAAVDGHRAAGVSQHTAAKTELEAQLQTISSAVASSSMSQRAAVEALQSQLDALVVKSGEDHAAERNAQMSAVAAVRSALDRVTEQHAAQCEALRESLESAERQRRDDVQRVESHLASDADRVTTIQETLVTMAWNIEHRSIDDTVSAVLHACVVDVEEKALAAAVAAHQQDVQLQLQVTRNKMEAMRASLHASLRDDYTNLRASIAVINQTLDGLVGRAPPVASEEGFLI
ncbi:hypothetical protein SDRG_01330 [Saprolegnia diclina VS20]|uniref:Uncharacterized protein n=1 Tax=Saprolegnia diclina (strain VS20) TaxID=1156394 RepID=T0R320_SAPDV|nr:hypothetical protein SDRG_01330 [Saprolegnia diclina VS20]EQC41356.1 hypothetical protein SDRG_01330 [Saprolegnia diclina VS20]|eukprot:XP_008605070.1 hypothetical protein SDRG_01330 [Saprolegnia diclina VS20]